MATVMDTVMARIPKAQRPPEMVRGFGGVRSLCLLTFIVAAPFFWGDAFAQVFNLRYGLDTRLTFTDNIDATSNNQRNAWVLDVSPSIGGGIDRQGGRVSTRFNVGFTGLQYSTDDGLQDIGLNLDATAEVEAIEDLFFVELDGSIRRDNLSLFTGRSSNDFLSTDEDDETRNFSIAPRLEFRLGSAADATVRYREEWFSGNDNSLSSQNNSEWNADIVGARAFGPFGWAINYRHSETSYGDSDRGDVIEESARLTLFYSLTPQVQLRGIGGYEVNDYGAGVRDRTSIVGAGFDWYPTPRTAISATFEDRFFGTGYDITIRHRRARSSFQLSAVNDVESTVQNFGSVYGDPFFVLFFNDPTLIGLFPDDGDREDFVRELLGLANDSFVSNSYYETESLRAIYTLSGVRNSISFSVFSDDRYRVGDTTGLRPEDVFFDSDRVESRGGSVSLSHRLSGRSSLNANVTRTDSESSNGESRETRRYVYSVGYSTSFGSRSVAGLTYRHQRSDGSVSSDDFTENVISANYGIRF